MSAHNVAKYVVALAFFIVVIAAFVFFSYEGRASAPTTTVIYPSTSTISKTNTSTLSAPIIKGFNPGTIAPFDLSGLNSGFYKGSVSCYFFNYSSPSGYILIIRWLKYSNLSDALSSYNNVSALLHNNSAMMFSNLPVNTVGASFTNFSTLSSHLKNTLVTVTMTAHTGVNVTQNFAIQTLLTALNSTANQFGTG